MDCLLIIAPQDAHKRLALQVYLGSNRVQCYMKVKALLARCYLVTRLEVEGFRVQVFVLQILPEVERLWSSEFCAAEVEGFRAQGKFSSTFFPKSG